METTANGAGRRRVGGRAGVLPDGAELEEMLKKPGMTQALVAQQYNTSAQAVSAKLRRHREGSNTDTGWKKYWPKDWFQQRPNGNGIRADHGNTYVYKRLLEYTKRRQGAELDENTTLKVDAFLDRLREHNLVVYYRYDDPSGFRLRNRRDSDDPHVIWVESP